MYWAHIPIDGLCGLVVTHRSDRLMTVDEKVFLYQSNHMWGAGVAVPFYEVVTQQRYLDLSRSYQVGGPLKGVIENKLEEIGGSVVVSFLNAKFRGIDVHDALEWTSLMEQLYGPILSQFNSRTMLEFVEEQDHVSVYSPGMNQHAPTLAAWTRTVGAQVIYHGQQHVPPGECCEEIYQDHSEMYGRDEFERFAFERNFPKVEGCPEDLESLIDLKDSKIPQIPQEAYDEDFIRRIEVLRPRPRVVLDWQHERGAFSERLEKLGIKVLTWFQGGKSTWTGQIVDVVLIRQRLCNSGAGMLLNMMKLFSDMILVQQDCPQDRVTLNSSYLRQLSYLLGNCGNMSRKSRQQVYEKWWNVRVLNFPAQWYLFHGMTYLCDSLGYAKILSWHCTTRRRKKAILLDFQFREDRDVVLLGYLPEELAGVYKPMREEVRKRMVATEEEANCVIWKYNPNIELCNEVNEWKTVSTDAPSYSRFVQAENYSTDCIVQQWDKFIPVEEVAGVVDMESDGDDE